MHHWGFVVLFAFLRSCYLKSLAKLANVGSFVELLSVLPVGTSAGSVSSGHFHLSNRRAGNIGFRPLRQSDCGFDSNACRKSIVCRIAQPEMTEWGVIVAVPTKITYWVRSKQTKEIGDFGRHPIPARFEELEDAKHYRREMNLRRGAFHPGYFIEEENDAPQLMSGINGGGYSLSQYIARVVRFPVR